MIRPRSALAATLASGVLLLVGCGSTDVPPEANLLVDGVPPLPEQASAAAGAAVYGQNCAGCHGGDGTGEFGPALTEGNLTRSVERVESVVREGRSPMPSFETILDDEQLRDVSAYVVSALRSPAGMDQGGNGGSGGASSRAPEEATAGTPDQRRLDSGRRSYDVYCAGCHGGDATGTPLGPPIDGSSPELAAVIRGGGDGMPAFSALLPAGRIEDLVAYLREDAPTGPEAGNG